MRFLLVLALAGCGGEVAVEGAAVEEAVRACNATAWRAGAWFRAGDVVTFNGAAYVAEHDNPGYDPTISTWFWDPTSCNRAPPPTPPSAGGTLAAILSKTAFESMFTNRNPFYTYEGLLQGAAKYPAFAATVTTDDRKREVAAYLANVNHETGGLFYIEEINKGDAIVGGSFGETIRTINGALECGGRNPAQVQSRIDAYLRFCRLLGVDPGSRTSC